MTTLQVTPRAAAFADMHQDEVHWAIAGAKRGFDFAESLLTQLQQRGSWSPAQLAAAQRCMLRDAERAAAPSPVAEVASEELEAAFRRAKASGLKWPKMKLAGFTMKLAGDNSRNPGSIYVTDEAGEYLGKVAGGRFSATRACSQEVKAQVAKVLADPLGEAKAFGLQAGSCCICSRELTDPASVEAGIGPICAAKFFG
jgi:hypothetical protein